MSRLIGYVCSDDSLMPAVVQELRGDVVADDLDEPSAVGFGWVQEARSLLRKHPRRAGESPDVLGLMSDIPARAIIAHVRDGDQPQAGTLDLQPFRFRSWVWAQDGRMPGFDQARGALMANIPDHIKRNVQGKSDEEVVFHRVLHELTESGALASPKTDPKLAARGLARAVLDVEQSLGAGDAFTLHAALITERLLLAVRIGGDELHYKRFEGIEERDKPLFAGHRPKPVKHPHFKSVFVTNQLADEHGEGWVSLADRSVMWVGRSWDVKVEGLEAVIGA